MCRLDYEKMKMMIAISLIVFAILYGSECAFKVHNGHQFKRWEDVPFKFVVALGGKVICTGSLVSNQWILTASHCICKAEPQIEYAKLRQINSWDSGPTKVKISKQVKHPKYDQCGKVSGHDAAMLKMVRAIDVAKEQMVLANLANVKSLPVGAGVYMIGYGMDRGGDTGVLRQGISEVTTCPEGKYPYEPICLKPGAERQYIRGGDSGGPMVVEVENRGPSVAGVVSGHEEIQFTDHYIMMYASVGNNWQFIKQYLD